MVVPCYPRIDMLATGQNIKRLMVAKNLTIDDMCVMLGIGTKQAIYKWYRGKGLPSIDTFLALRTVFSVQIEDIIVYDVDDYYKEKNR